jgi:hypothetical protein
MAKYFNYFPKTLYSLEDKGSKLDTITNIIARFGFEDRLKENSASFYKYQIKDSDTPEIIASKFYDNPERHWIVLLFNNVIDPQWDWPLTDRRLNEYIDNKYSSPEYADTANTSISGLTFSKYTEAVLNNPEDEYKVHGLYKTVEYKTSEKTEVLKYKIDYFNYITLAPISGTYRVADGTTVTLNEFREVKSHYDYEVEENEKKREIKLLKTEFVSAVEKEFKRTIRQ